MALPVMVLSLKRSNGPPWCDLLKIHTCKAYSLWQQPLLKWSLYRGLGQGVVDEWSIEKHLSGCPPGTVHGRRCWRGLSLTFKTLPSILSHYSNTPLLHHSSPPLLPQPRDLKAHVRPPYRGLQTKPRPPGIDSLLQRS